MSPSRLRGIAGVPPGPPSPGPSPTRGEGSTTASAAALESRSGTEVFPLSQFWERGLEGEGPSRNTLGAVERE